MWSAGRGEDKMGLIEEIGHTEEKNCIVNSIAKYDEVIQCNQKEYNLVRNILENSQEIKGVIRGFRGIEMYIFDRKTVFFNPFTKKIFIKEYSKK